MFSLPANIFHFQENSIDQILTLLTNWSSALQQHFIKSLIFIERVEIKKRINTEASARPFSNHPRSTQRLMLVELRFIRWCFDRSPPSRYSDFSFDCKIAFCLIPFAHFLLRKTCLKAMEKFTYFPIKWSDKKIKGVRLPLIESCCATWGRMTDKKSELCMSNILRSSNN